LIQTKLAVPAVLRHAGITEIIPKAGILRIGERIMASFKKVIKNTYGVKTFQDTKNTYDWITKALQRGNFPKLRIDADFLFDISEISCSCEGISEFVENAYGQAGYKLAMFHLCAYSEDKRVAFILVDPFAGVTISTGSKVMLERVVNLIENTTLEETEVNNPISVTYVETQINNDGVIVNGDNNIVANNHSEVEVEKEKKESGFKAFWNGVFQNVASNFLWYLLTLAAGGLLTYLLTN
jgi:hypothetical protein